jgi:hypothetical protein
MVTASRSWVAAGVTALAIVLGFAAWSGYVPGAVRSGGPLAVVDFGLSGASVSSSDEEWSFGLAMLVNEIADGAVVERIEIERNEGIDVIGLGLGPHMTEEIWAQVVVPGSVHG